MALSSETFHNYVSAAMVHVNHALKLIMRLFLVEDLVDSLKVSTGLGLGCLRKHAAKHGLNRVEAPAAGGLPGEGGGTREAGDGTRERLFLLI